MKFDLTKLGDGVKGSRDYEQKTVRQYSVLEETTAARDKANRAFRYRHDDMHDSDNEYGGGRGIDRSQTSGGRPQPDRFGITAVFRATQISRRGTARSGHHTNEERYE